MQYNTALTLQIAEHPYIVVAYEIVYLHTAVCQFGYLTQETGIAFGHNIFVLIPVVEHVAQHINGLRLILDVIKETHQTAFLHTAVINGPGAQMRIGNEIYTLHSDWVLYQSQFKFSLFTHHILVPFGFKDQVYSGRFDTFQPFNP